MERNLLYVIGPPGVGKTAAVGWALQDVPVVAEASKPVPHITYPGGIQLGAARASFGGTDAMGMAIQPKVVEWLTSAEFPYEYVLAEGDRLANLGFFEALVGAGWTVELVSLTAPDHVLARRRSARGSNQDPTWLRGRATKVQRLAMGYTGKVFIIPAGYAPVQEVGAQIRRHPFVQALKG